MKKDSHTLYIFSGLPATGKTTLAQMLAGKISAVYLRIDTVEQGLRDLCSINVEAHGYRLSYRIATDNLKIGNSVVADSCNPIQLTRDEWQDVATSINANFQNIEIICSNQNQHRDRAENRTSSINNLKLPGWQAIVNREYHKWNNKRIIIDTAEKTVEESFSELLNKLNIAGNVKA